jgi:hypothetical protein
VYWFTAKRMAPDNNMSVATSTAPKLRTGISTDSDSSAAAERERARDQNNSNPAAVATIPATPMNVVVGAKPNGRKAIAREKTELMTTGEFTHCSRGL